MRKPSLFILTLILCLGHAAPEQALAGSLEDSHTQAARQFGESVGEGALAAKPLEAAISEGSRHRNASLLPAAAAASAAKSSPLEDIRRGREESTASASAWLARKGEVFKTGFLYPFVPANAMADAMGLRGDDMRNLIPFAAGTVALPFGVLAGLGFLAYDGLVGF